MLRGFVPELVVDGVVRGPCELAFTRKARRRGLLGRDFIAGAFLLQPCRNVHTLSMRFAIDVAYLRSVDSSRYSVLRVHTMLPNRLDRPVVRASAVLEAGAGSFADWALKPGSWIEIVR
jgi:uncharacterized protein